MSLDSLATNGIINFDPDAYIKSGAARFEGENENEKYLPFDKPLLATPQMYGMPYGTHGESENDAFISHKKEHHSKHNWKGIITLAIIGGLGIFTGAKIKSLFNKKPKVNTPVKTLRTKVGEFFEHIASWFKAEGKKEVKDVAQKAPQKAPDKVVEKEVGKAAEKSKGVFKKLPKWTKVTGGIAAGLLGLFAVYKAFFAHKAQAHMSQHPVERQSLHKSEEQHPSPIVHH